MTTVKSATVKSTSTVKRKPAPKKLSRNALVKLLVAQTPDGWSVSSGVGYHDGWSAYPSDDPKSAHVVFEKGCARIALNVSAVTEYRREHAFMGQNVEGHTLVNGRSFTRRGIDCSSCELSSDVLLYENQYHDLASLLDGQFKRCADADSRQKTAEAVPGTPMTRQPEWFVETAAALKARKSVTLLPHGMGVGYRFSVKRSTWAERANPALEARLSVSPIYVEHIDHD